jgi:AraC-like DNA-binding protein
MDSSCPTPGTPAPIRVHTLPVRGNLSECVGALMAVEMGETGPVPLAIAPHESLMLSVQFARSSGDIEAKGEHGQNTALTGIRQWTGSFQGAGNCISLFALLTPLGAVRLLESQPLEGLPRIRARVAELLDRPLTRRLESDIALANGLEAKLLAFAAWLEARAGASRRLTSAALRAGRAAMRICTEPSAPAETLAREQHVSRRQLERDFARWIGTSPAHLAQVARVQAVSRKARSGASLADIAADVGFADQSHMSRVVRRLTGLTPRCFARGARSPIGTAFQQAIGGGTVYL